jgi:hypothetical protein
MEQGTDQGMDSGDAGRWLTYRELAESRQIDRHSAVKLVLKHGWRRQRDNRNVLRVLVPVEWMAPRAKGMPSGTDRAMPQGMPQAMPEGTDFSRAISALEGALAALTARAEAAEQRADRLDLLIETERGRIIAVEAKATVAEQGRERAEAQAAELRERLEQAEAAAERARREALHEAREAAQALDALRAVETARLEQGLLARLRAAWRGR